MVAELRIDPLPIWNTLKTKNKPSKLPIILNRAFDGASVTGTPTCWRRAGFGARYVSTRKEIMKGVAISYIMN